MVYSTMLIILVAMPMSIMSIEIVRMMFVDVHLQSAVDAARDFIGYAHCQLSGRSTRDAGFPIILKLFLFNTIFLSRVD
jgi:hypothetical protein